MKQTMKKVVSLLLSVLMIASVCTVAIATETEEVPTLLDFGIVEGNGVGQDTVVKFGDEYVIKLAGGSPNYNLKLANKLLDPDSESPDEAIVGVNGTTYTVFFDYYLNAATGFQIRPMKDPSASGQRGTSIGTLTGYNKNHAGDGQWHTAAITFLFNAQTSGDVTLDNIGFLHQCTSTTEPGYIKNIRIVLPNLGVAGANVYNVVPDPVVEGEAALKMEASTGRNNFLLSSGKNEDGSEIPFDPTADTYYTVKFDYFYEEGTITPDFRLYYGTSDPHKTGKKTITVEAYSSSNDDSLAAAVGDGKWHTGAFTFKAADTTLTDGTTDAPYVYLTYMGGSSEGEITLSGYVKNIEVIEETGALTTYGTTNHDMSIHLTASIMGSYGSNMSSSYLVDKDGNKLASDADTTGANIVLVSSHNATLSAGGSSYCQSRCFMVNKSTPVKFYANATYKVSFKYKVITGTTNTYGYVGLGYQKNGAHNTGSAHYIIDVDKYAKGATTTDWVDYECTFTPTYNSGVNVGYVRLIVEGKALAVQIADVTITYTGLANAPIISYNDNGNIETDVAYVGTTIEKAGNNADNAAIGEELIGWYTSPDFATTAKADVYPENTTTLYARYPSTIVDFDYRGSYTDNLSCSVTAKADNAAGVLNVTYGQWGGFMLPAYDATISDSTTIDDTAISSIYGTRHEAFYQFKEGTSYRVTLVYKQTSGEGAMSLEFMPATRYGSAGKRDTESSFTVSFPASEGEDYITYSTDFTFNINEASTKAAYTYLSGDNDDVCAIAMRISSADRNVVIDKIIITEMSDETRPYASAKVTTEDGDNVVTNIVKPGDIIVMPEVTEPEGKLFVGWYDKTYNFTGGADKSEKAIPVSALRVTSDMVFNTVTYVAKYIDKATMEIDFSSQYYQGNDTSGTAWSEYPLNEKGAVASNIERAKHFRVLTDENGNSYARFDAGTAEDNIFKINLYTADKKNLIAYEGVTYEITIDYNYISAGKGNDVTLGISRCAMWGFMPHALDGLYEQGTSKFADKSTALNERRTQTQTHTVRNTYIASDGDTSRGSVKITNRFSLMVRTGVAEIYNVKITPVSYTAPAFLNVDSEKGSVDVDYENGTVTVTPNEGYEVSAKGVTTVQTYRDYTVGKDSNGNDYCYADDFVKTALSNATTDGKVFKFDNNVDGVKLSSLRFEVNFVKTEDTNAAYIAMSKRTPGTVNDKYQSAGIRFRLRASASDANNASEIGFVFVPKKALTLESVKTVEAYMTKRANGELTNADYSVSGVAKNKDAHIFYDDSVSDYLDYQVWLTKLTNKNYDDEKNEKMMALEFYVATYFVDAEGNTTYVNLDGVWSYNKVAGK